MGFLTKLFTSSGSKYAARFKPLERLLAGDKLNEAEELLKQLKTELPEDASADEVSLLHESQLQLFESFLAVKDNPNAIRLGKQIIADSNESVGQVLEPLLDMGSTDPELLILTRKAVDDGLLDKRLMLRAAKQLFAQKKDQLGKSELEFVTDTASRFPLWKEGIGTLADRYLSEDRQDAEALVVYRNAYPNRKADRKLREVLLQSLVLNKERDEFSASVYKDAVETGDNPEALHLLAEYYIERKEFLPNTIPYIERALGQSEFTQEALKNLTELVLNSKESGIDKVVLLLAIYRQGYKDRNLLTLLSDSLADANRFDQEAISVMTGAFEQRVVSKRAILILTEHCLANEREDEFALRVYESYLSTWPDRPQRQIYHTLAHHYAALTRVDDQAQKIYEEALEDSPTDSIIVTILARAYLAAHRQDELADDIYRRAFPVAELEVKKQLASVLAQLRLDANDYSEDTLQYLTIMGRPESGPLKDRYQEALTNCFLATGRRGEMAQQSYFELFRETKDSPDLNPRLVSLLSDIIKERGVAPDSGSVEMQVYGKLFEQQKFSTDADICFILLADALGDDSTGLNTVHLAVRCFEAEADRLIEILTSRQQLKLLQETGDFYIEHYNFPLAAKAFTACFEQTPTDALRYRLVKIHLLDVNGERALELLSELNSPEYATLRLYWEAAAYQTLNNPTKASELLKNVPTGDKVPAFLVQIRQAMNLELEGQQEAALAEYKKLVATKEFPQFQRWLGLEQGIVLMQLERLAEAREHLEEVHRHNPSGRAEQLFLSIALYLQGAKLLHEKSFAEALPLFTQAVEVNRNHRVLREVCVKLLCLHGEQEFFANNLQNAATILEVAHRILPKRLETKVLLAYSYHRMQQYAKALIYYRDITWSDDNPRLERSQAYAYMANSQPHHAWRVFLDLAKRGNMLRENFPRLVHCFLEDEAARGVRAWVKAEFPSEVDGLQLTALLMHDGQYQRAVDTLNQLIKANPDNQQMRWYLGLAYSRLDQRDLAVHNWKELLRLCAEGTGSKDQQARQLTEIGTAFLEAGYAQEALQTWEIMRNLNEKNPDLPVLYGATLDLNAYQLAHKDQTNLARDEWSKALKYDPDNWLILHNLAISQLLSSNLDEATKLFNKLGLLWKSLATQNPRQHGQLGKLVRLIERVMNTIQLTKGRPEFDITKVRAEDTIEYYQQANHFYWILGLDKYASEMQIEHEYFRLIKIFNPERHADDFMLVEESYTNLIKNPERRQLIDLFVFNPLRIDLVRQRLKHLGRDGRISFEIIDLPVTVPPPDFQQLEPMQVDEATLMQPLSDVLVLNLKIPDWVIL